MLARTLSSQRLSWREAKKHDPLRMDNKSLPISSPFSRPFAWEDWIAYFFSSTKRYLVKRRPRTARMCGVRLTRPTRSVISLLATMRLVLSVG